MTIHLSDYHAPAKQLRRSARLQRIYERSIAARTAKEKADLWKPQYGVNKQQVAVNPDHQTTQL